MPKGNPHPRLENLTGMGKGRKKGVPNKITRTVKEMLIEAANELNADPVTSLVAMAKEKGGLPAFWGIASRLIPTEITGKDGDPIDMKMTVEFITAKQNENPDT